MKIYHEEDESVQEIISEADNLVNRLSPEHSIAVQPLVTIFKKVVEDKMYYFQEYNKYLIMWALRSIEEEITNEGGVIIITKDGSIKMKEFSTELVDKIKQLLKK